jgi:hypothetical protein
MAGKLAPHDQGGYHISHEVSPEHAISMVAVHAPSSALLQLITAIAASDETDNCPLMAD